MQRRSLIQIFSIATSLTASMSAAQVQDQAQKRQDDLELERAFVYVAKNAVDADLDGDRALCITSQFKMNSTTSHFLHGNNAQNHDRADLYQAARVDFPGYGIQEDQINLRSPEEVAATASIDQARVIETPNAKPIEVKTFIEEMKAVIQEESAQFPLKLTSVPNWTEEFKRDYRDPCKVASRLPKLLLALGYGVTTQYFPTGTEDRLATEMLKAPLRSLTPIGVFRSSYRINEGDLYLTLMTIENVLSRHWDEKQREERQISLRLNWISNCVSGCNNFGAWYHLFGEMLYGYAYGSLAAYTVGIIENVGGVAIARKFYGGQEYWMNRIGARLGGKLRRFGRSAEGQALTDPSDTDSEEAMNSTPSTEVQP